MPVETGKKNYVVAAAQEGEVVQDGKGGRLVVDRRKTPLGEQGCRKISEALNDGFAEILAETDIYHQFSHAVRLRVKDPTTGKPKVAYYYVDLRTRRYVEPGEKITKTVARVVDPFAEDAEEILKAPPPPPKSETESEAEPETAPEPESEVESEAKAVPAAEPESEPPPKAEPESKPEPRRIELSEADTKFTRKRSPSFTVAEEERMVELQKKLKDTYPTGVNGMLRKWIMERLSAEEGKLAPEGPPEDD